MDSNVWRDKNIENWKHILAPYRNRFWRVLEIGSWEGDSALFWHSFLGASVKCIDNWENPTLTREAAKAVEDRFDENTLNKPIEKIKMDSTKALYVLGKGKYEFELIYIDGDHHRDQVMIDSCLAWRLLRPGCGIMIWDDWRDYCPYEPNEKRPETAIRKFVEMHFSELDVLADTGQQLFVMKQETSHAIQENRQGRIYFPKGKQIHRQAGEAILR